MPNEGPEVVEPKARVADAARDKSKAVVEVLRRRRRWIVFWIDPELAKALDRTVEVLARIEGALRRGAPTVEPGALLALEAAIARVDPDAKGQRAWEIREELRLQLLGLLTPSELKAEMEVERDRDKKPHRKGRNRDPKRVAAGSESQWAAVIAKIDADHPTEAVESARAIYRSTIEDVRHDRAVDQLRANYEIVFVLELVLVLAAAAWALATFSTPLEVHDSLCLLLSGGALGALLSGVMKFRHVRGGLRVLRRYVTLNAIQPLVGSASALFVYAAMRLFDVRAANVDLATVDAHFVLGFVAGFSEPFFLGLVGKVGQIGSEPPAAADDAEPTKGEPT